MAQPCRECKRTYAPGATSVSFQGNEAEYYLTMSDKRELLRVRDYSFREKKKPVVMYRWRNNPNHVTQQPRGMFGKHRPLQNNVAKRELADSIISWFNKNEDPTRVTHQLHDLWVFEPTDGQQIGSTLRPIDNFSTTVDETSINQDIDWAPLSTRNFLTKPKYFIIRTMHDRDVNLADLAWVVKLAMLSNNNVDAIFLHDDNFVWFNWRSIPKHDERARYNKQVETMFENLNNPNPYRPRSKKYLMAKNFQYVLQRTVKNIQAMSSELREDGIPYGNIGVFEYPKETKRYFFSRPQRPPCRVCNNSGPLTSAALTNDIGNASNHFYLTAADILTLQSIRNETFGPRMNTNGQMTLPGKNFPLMGYFKTNIANNHMKDLSAQYVHRSNKKIEEGDMPTLLKRLLAHANFITIGKDDQMMDEIGDLPGNLKVLTVFRTMPDRSANMKDVVWALKFAASHDIWVNAFFLHKKSAVWVAARPPADKSSLGLRRARDARNSLKKNKYLWKSTLDKINNMEGMKGNGRIVFFEYPNRSFMAKLTTLVNSPTPLVKLGMFALGAVGPKAYPYAWSGVKLAVTLGLVLGNLLYNVSPSASTVWNGTVTVGSGAIDITKMIPYSVWFLLNMFYGSR